MPTYEYSCRECGTYGSVHRTYKEDEEFKDFIDFNDLGLPLAYFASERLCEVSDDGARYIMETWLLFLKGLGLEYKDETTGSADSPGGGQSGAAICGCCNARQW